MIELFFEHILFSLYGVFINLAIYDRIGSIKGLALFSTLTSLFSVIMELFNSYKYRLKYNKYFKKKNEIKFSDFSLKTKLFLTYPFTS